MKHIPNCISMSRIVFALLLFFTAKQPLLFAGFYLLCGVSDILDGFIARRYNLQSTLGSKLDSLGDFIFWLIVFILLVQYKLQSFATPVFIAIGVVLLVRAVNFTITKLKFHQWGMLHTIGNKLAGLALYFVVVLLFAASAVSPWAVVVLFAVSVISALEETLILITSKTYLPDQKSYFRKT